MEKENRRSEQVEDRDSSIWVLFIKKLESETFQVRFPDEPVYTHLEPGGLRISAEKEGDQYELTVWKGAQNQAGPDLLYQLEGKWIREHFVQSEVHLFHFKTCRSTLDSELSNQFFSSLSIVKNS